MTKKQSNIVRKWLQLIWCLLYLELREIKALSYYRRKRVEGQQCPCPWPLHYILHVKTLPSAQLSRCWPTCPPLPAPMSTSPSKTLVTLAAIILPTCPQLPRVLNEKIWAWKQVVLGNKKGQIQSRCPNRVRISSMYARNLILVVEGHYGSPTGVG